MENHPTVTNKTVNIVPVGSPKNCAKKKSQSPKSSEPCVNIEMQMKIHLPVLVSTAKIEPLLAKVVQTVLPSRKIH